MLPRSAAADVFSVPEVARAAGVAPAAVRSLIAAGQVRATDGFLSASQSLRCIRILRNRVKVGDKPDLFAPPIAGERSPGPALAASSALHAAMLGVIVLITTFGISTKADEPQPSQPSRLVFLAIPGPGGGGGGGGLKLQKPAVVAEMKGTAKLKSPVPPPKPLTTRKPVAEARPVPPPMPRPVYRREEPPPPPAPPPVTPQVVAPVVNASSDARDRGGVLSESAAQTESQGTGSGGGAGSGQGSGIGEGTGTGIGPGSGGGTGGGPYRPGSGVSAPELLREIRPEFTEEARRQGISGDVVLEIVVRADGSVGDVKVLGGLGGGLNRNAVDAVKQWRFSPARRQGVPVDVMVEVAVAFKLR
ncbi:MAG: energy transducer TonB [Acidobacteriota bacterium]|nr:energy transducer TonB [Acidobacteriota bacterium]